MKKKRDIKKYKNLLKISKHIDKLKRKINKDLEQTKFNKNKLIALVLKIMDLCNFRSGNKLYEKKYGSYGITTIHKKHVLLKKDYIEIDFVGKKGVNNNCIIKNKIIQNIIKDVYNLSVDKKSYLFSIIYNKNPIQITVLDVNNYLKIFDITTKDLRTWNANVIFLKNLMKIVKNINETYYKKNNIKQLKLRKKMIKEAIQNTAISLHHTPSICKSSYIYKLIIEKLLNNSNIFDNIKKYNEPEDLLRYFL
jgi:DNA topoisomerase-1